MMRRFGEPDEDGKPIPSTKIEQENGSTISLPCRLFSGCSAEMTGSIAMATHAFARATHANIVATLHMYSQNS
jgi:hypothetical protein